MNRIDGIYAGNNIWASSYEDGEFEDRIISPEMTSELNREYITSDLESIVGQSKRAIALAYYVYSIISKSRKRQKRVFEILCDGSSVELFVIEGFEQKVVNVLLHQKENMTEDESERFLASKYISELFADEYPDNEEITRVYNALQDYEYNVLSEDDNKDNSETEELMNYIYKQMDLKKDDMILELFDKRIVISKEQYINSVSDDILNAYISIVHKLIRRISNSFEKDDIVYLYVKNLVEKRKLRKQVDKIAESNCIQVEVESLEEYFISRGNAYIYYLRNHVIRNKIKNNLGRFSFIFEQKQVSLDIENGEIYFIASNDFEDRYRFSIYDSKTKRISPVDLQVPFSINESKVKLVFSYEAEGLKITIEDINSGETLQEVFSYNI